MCFDSIPELLFDFDLDEFQTGEELIEGANGSTISIIANGTFFPDVAIDFDGDGQVDESAPGWSWDDIFLLPAAL